MKIYCKRSPPRTTQGLNDYGLGAPFVLALVLALLGVACSPAASPSPGAPRPTPAPVASSRPAPPGAQVGAGPVIRVPPPPTSPPATPDKVTYGIVGPNPFHWVALVAEAKNLMEPYGIDFDLVLTRTAPSAISALASGALDLSTSSPGASWDVQQKSPGFKQVLEILSTNPYSLIVQPDITSYEDLRGKTLAGQTLTSGGDVEMLRLLLNEHGLQYSRDYDILAVGLDRRAALLANQVAAAALLPPSSFELLDHGKRTLDEAWKYPFFRDVTTVNVLARESWYQEKPDVARRFVQAYLAATAWLYDPRNREEAIRILSEQTRMDPKYAERTYQQFVVDMQLVPANPRIDPRHLAQAYANLKRLGLNVPDDPMSLVDNSLVDRALQ